MRPLTLLLLLLTSSIANSQTISGMLFGEDGRSLPNATITLRRFAGNTVLKYAVSDDKGSFRLPLPKNDSVRLEVSFAGYEKRDTVFITQKDVFIEWILIQQQKSLEAVTVNSAKPIFQVLPDKVVFNVGQSITSVGGTALELLQKSPGVLVDPNDAISMNGKSGVRIYMDGRPSPLSLQEITAMLRTIPSGDVEAIEIISNPSSRYEAAGNAGIINIRFKKNKTLGTNGTINTGWSIAIFPKYNGSISLNHRNRKLNLFGSYSYNHGDYEAFLNLFRFQNDSIFDQRSITLSESKSHNGKIGADWFLNKKQTLGILVNVNHSDNSSQTVSRTPIAGQSTKEVVQVLDARTDGARTRTNLSSNMNYRFADTSGRVLSIDADYSFFEVDGRARTLNVFTASNNDKYQTQFSNHTPVNIRFYALQASWEQKLWKGKFSAGIRSAAAKTSNRFSFFTTVNDSTRLDVDRSSDFTYTERIHAAYALFNRQEKKWNYSAGLRLEYTQSLGELIALNPVSDERVKRGYLNAFPSAGISYQVNKDHQLSISYSRRIDRPSYQDLNPFENRIDELTYQKGNPFLRPQFTDNIELRHTYKYKLTTTLTYSDVQDFFAAITDTIEGRRNFITQRNIAQQRIIGIGSSMPFAFTKWWSGFASIGVNHNRYRADFGEGKVIRINNTVLNVYQQHSFVLGKKWSAELSSFYLSPYVWAGNYECRSIWNIDLGLQWKILKEQGSLKLTVTDIFRRMPWAGTSRLGSLVVVASGGWESRQLRLNFSYRFGSKEVKAARQRASGVEDLNKRVQ